MTKIEQLVKRHEFVRKMWVNSHTQAEEDEWYAKLQMVEKEIKAYKARKDTTDPASNAMAQFIKFGIEKPTEG